MTPSDWRSRPRRGYAAVLLAKSRRTVAVDVSDPGDPRVIGRTPAVTAGAPYVSAPGDPIPDWIMMPAGLG